MNIGSLVPTADIPRRDPDQDGDELTVLTQFLDYHRATLRLKCAGLGPADLKRASAPPSRLTLLGLVRHLTEVELGWFSQPARGQVYTPTYSSAERPDDDFDDLDSADIDSVWTAYENAVTASRSTTAGFTSGDETETGSKGPRSLRWLLVHMIEEYARHNGHADLLREAIDGARGE